MRGPKPKAAELERHGRPKHAVNADTPASPPPLPIGGRNFPEDAPADLDHRAQALWNQIVPHLMDHNVLSLIDEAGMRLLVTQWARAEEAREALERDLEAELPELDDRLAENRRLLLAIKRNVAQRLSAQTQGLEAAREALKLAVTAGDRGQAISAIGDLIEKIEGAAVSPGELASIAKLETTMASLEEFLELRRQGRKVALGSTGQIVEHPLVGSERAAAGMVLRFGEHYAVTPVARARLGLAALQGASLKADLDREIGASTRKRGGSMALVTSADVKPKPDRKKPPAKRKNARSGSAKRSTAKS